MAKFARLDRLPPYVFATVNGIKMEARRIGQDIIDLGMGNPDLGTPEHIVDKLVEEIRQTYQERRDTLISGLNRIGWDIPSPKGTMFVWGKIPEQYRKMGSVEFIVGTDLYKGNVAK